MTPTVLKLGGELLEDRQAIAAAAAAVVRLAAATPLIVVHGGGRAIDGELRARGETPRFVDGLRVTDAAALDVVVSVLAGRTNTAFVAAINACGGRAVGLTGADAMLALSTRAALFTSTKGEQVDLGLVGEPVASEAADGDADRLALLKVLLRAGYIPVVASIGTSREGELLNVNADTLAGHLAAAFPADRLVIAGGTAGVLDPGGATLPSLTLDDIGHLTRSGAAHSGMVAKLAACARAIAGGVAHVSIVSGRGDVDYTRCAGTTVVASPEAAIAR